MTRDTEFDTPPARPPLDHTPQARPPLDHILPDCTPLDHTLPDYARLDYARLTDTTWRILNATPGRRAELLAALPPAERTVVAKGTSGPGFDMEQARRRKTVADVLNVSFPVTFFAYYGRTGAEGLHAFLDSEFWQRRPAQPGSVFPPAATASAAFAGFLRASDWLARQEDWVGEAFAFEDAHLFGGATADPRPYSARRPRLVAGAWIAEATFDVPAYGGMLRERAAVDPWTEALLLVKRRPAPLAVISVPAGERVRRVRLTGATVAALRWLWDTGTPMPGGAAGTPAYARAVGAGLVEGSAQ
ncbi:hypothetical protein MUK60_22025 [Streptomyces sp. LRE541]|uniref:hypothetical protein n=1 Tax=Streptomyces sp. LRE541 TaxID=2931983 RepID=UPI00200C41F1|nr:hypothetical protein [Streptomyces sp. LRE541]UPZ30218.1 hypothetical protein MUK60_22025 [Streptomyces sp. LRE541]